MSPVAWAVEIAVAILFLALLAVRLRRVVVRRTAEHEELWLRRGFRATLQGGVSRADPLLSRLAYTDGFLLFPPPPGGRALFIGAGVGIGPRQLAALVPDAAVTVVDNDPAVVRVAAARFGLRGVELRDGRAFLEDDGRAFELIVLDAFGAGVFPARLATVEAFRLCRARLADPGTLVVNLGGTLSGRLASVWAALVEVFGPDHARAFGVPHDGPFDPDRRGNTLAFGFRGEVPAPTALRPPFLPALGAIAASPVQPPPAPPLRDAEVGEFLPIA